jgi:hypothetical protein
MCRHWEIKRKILNAFFLHVFLVNYSAAIVVFLAGARGFEPEINVHYDPGIEYRAKKVWFGSEEILLVCGNSV